MEKELQKKDLEPKKEFKGKGKRRFNKRNPKQEIEGGNDFSFWNEYPELMDIATRFPWMHIAGTPLKGDKIAVDLPNVAVQLYYPMVGISNSATDPINLMFRKMYLDMHRRYRGIGAYQASDIAITVICIESAIQRIVELERVYGILNAYPLKSRIEPEGLLLAMGYAPAFITDAKSHRADFRYQINRLIRLASRLPLPSGMNFFKNHTALNGFVYKDSQDERADLLVFLPRGYYKYKTTGQTGCINSAGTALLTTYNPSGYSSVDSFVISIEADLNTLLSDSDILRITSDFIACYGEANMQVLMPLPEDYTVVPMYDEATLSKWHNSEHYGNSPTYLGYVRTASDTALTIGTADTFAVYQRNDVIISRPTFHRTTGAAWKPNPGGQEFFIMSTNAPFVARDQHVADTWQSDPTKDTICEAMLWKTWNLGQVSTDATPLHCIEVKSTSTELLADCIIATVSNSAVLATNVISSSDINYAGVSFINSGIYHFDWHPYMFGYDSNNNVVAIYGDTDNITTVSNDVIAKITDAALLSAFAVKINNTGSDKQ